jgi:3-methylfumaryl-CoA hydratase
VSRIDLDHLRRWIGKSRTDEDVIALRHARLLATTIDYFASERLADHEPLPALWHWIYFLEGLPQSELGRDGHPARGGFLPPVPLANRMWAGGRLRFHAPVTIGAIVRRKSSIHRIDRKLGRSGELVLVSVLHELESPSGELLVREEHDIVYKDPSPAATGIPPAVAPAGATFTREFTPMSVTLFRYSALTFNGHRIHYDADYAREVEGYPGVVVHGPLIATMLAGYAEEIGGQRLRSFDYRALAPMFLGSTLVLEADRHGSDIELHATCDNGQVCMRATAGLE